MSARGVPYLPMLLARRGRHGGEAGEESERGIRLRHFCLNVSLEKKIENYLLCMLVRKTKDVSSIPP